MIFTELMNFHPLFLSFLEYPIQPGPWGPYEYPTSWVSRDADSWWEHLMASLWEVEQYSGNFFGAFGMLETQGFKRV